MSDTVKLSNSMLKGKLTDAMVFRGYCSDLDTVTQPGYYSVGDSTKNRPASIYGTLEFYTGTFQSQVIRCTDGSIYQRVGQTNFGSWRVLRTTAVT